MPHFLIGPLLALAGLILLYCSIHGLPRSLPQAAGYFWRTRVATAALVAGIQRWWRKLRSEPNPPVAGGRTRKQWSAAPSPWPQMVPVWLLMALLASLGGGFAIGRASRDFQAQAATRAEQPRVSATATTSVTVAAVQPNTPTPMAGAADRHDCGAISGSEYRSESERSWFLATCVDLEGLTGNLWTAPLSACPSGLAFTVGASSTGLPEPAKGRIFCLTDNLLLPKQGLQVAGAFLCPQGAAPVTQRAVLQLAGRSVDMQELRCGAT